MQALFQVVGVYAPLRTFPSPSIPLFGSVEGKEERYRAVMDGDERISAFVPIPRRFARRAQRVKDRILRAVGEGPVFAYSLSPTEGAVFESRDDFATTLRRWMCDGRFESFPLAGLEVARFLGLRDQECAMAESAAMVIADISFHSAQDWIVNGHLSAIARDRAQEALRSFVEASTEDLPVWVSTLAEKHYRRLLDTAGIARKVVDLNEVGVVKRPPRSLLIHGDDLTDSPDKNGVIHTLEAVHQSGTVITLVKTDPSKILPNWEVRRLIGNTIMVGDPRGEPDISTLTAALK